MQRLRVATLHADMRLRLLRARELCLLGDYASGVPEFRRVLHDIKRQCAFSAAPEVRQFLTDLQAEYALLLQYERTLKDLSAVGRSMRQQQQQARRPLERALTADNARQSPPVDESDATSREKRLPTWARKPDVPRTSKVPSKPTRKVSPVGAASKKAKATRDKENNSRNVVTRARKAPPATAPPAMKSTALMALTRNQPPPKISSKRAKGVDGNPVRPTANRRSSVPSSEDGDTIAGKTKYSDIAKEGGWADQELIESIEREIVDRGERVSFQDIAGHDHTKQLLQEAIMLPQIAPHLFRVRRFAGVVVIPGSGD
ncbi:hypothetical protein PINS_up014448 [Pythium insidiosum]|nr:hypothetical protein PINS_up014448 [Pythium insidiosum]